MNLHPRKQSSKNAANRSKAWRAKMKREGKCTTCGIHPPTPPRLTCDFCLQRKHDKY